MPTRALVRRSAPTLKYCTARRRTRRERVARGVRVVFVFARGEPGIDLLKLQAGNSVKRLAERCRIHTVNGGDHVFTRSGPRATMEKIVSDELFARSEWLDTPTANLKTGGLKFD